MEDSYNDNEETRGRFSLRGLLGADGAIVPALLCALCLGMAAWETVKILFL